MRILWDEPTRRTTLTTRGLDFATLEPAFFQDAAVTPARNGRFRATGVRPKCWERLRAAGINLPPEMFSGAEEVR